MTPSAKAVARRWIERQGATAPLPPPNPREPGLQTLPEFLKDRNPQGKYHDPGSYDFDFVKMNTDHSLQVGGTIQNPGGGDDYTVEKSARGYLIKRDQRTVVGVVHAGTLYAEKGRRFPVGYWDRHERTHVSFEVRTTKVVKYPQEYAVLVSDLVKRNREAYPNLIQNIRVKGEAYQIRSEGPPQKDKGTSLAVLNAAGMVVAQAQDEWGATLIVVAQEYRGRGLGEILGAVWYEWNPSYTSGGFTARGEANAVKLWEGRVRRFLSNGWYSELVKAGTLTRDRVAEILSGIKGGPRKLVEEPAKPSVAPNVLVYAEAPTFVIYNETFLTDPVEDHIHAYGFFRGSEEKVFLYAIEYERPFQRMATEVALQMARDEGDRIYVGEGYGDLVEYEGVPGVVQEGDYIRLTKDILNLKALAARERKVRQALDPLRESYHQLLEQAESKWQ